MFKAIIAASMVSLVPSVAFSKTEPSTTSPTWGQYKNNYQPTERQVSPRTHHVHKRSSHPPIRTPEKTAPPSELTRLQADVTALRRELAAIREEVGSKPFEPSPLARMIAIYPRLGLQKPLEEAPDSRSLPNLGLGSPFPEGPSLPSLGRIEGVDQVRLARLYLIKTSTPGYTMTRLTPEVSIGRLHPDFVLHLQDAIKRAREAGLSHCGIYSAYRPPIFGIGGFSDKFNSLHSYGLAVDVVGIGSAGSKSALLWKRIVESSGLFLPYGAQNTAEFNHVQLIPTKVATPNLRRTITATAPKDLDKMWLASGIHDHIIPAAVISSAHLLPENEFAK